MPFDVCEFPPAAIAADRNRRAVAIWLFAMCGMLLVMIVLGGATRLTGSGLSIMEWAPIMGALPPLSETEWHRLFALYQQIPQYQLQHEGFGLEGFRRIFWLEWTHRLWGRLTGIVFLVPLVWLWARKAIDRRLGTRLALLFALGGFQGAVGWFMVASGFFPDSISVSAYRLVIHLSLALLLYGSMLWTGLTLTASSDGPPPGVPRYLLGCSVLLIALTIVAGGFVAGNHAGLIYNTFPLMDGALIPPGYADLRPFLRNLTENLAAVQFDHRLLATLTALTALIASVAGLRSGAAGRLRWALRGLAIAVLAQYALGVATLVEAVPVGAAVLHQALAVVVFSAALIAFHASRRPAA